MKYHTEYLHSHTSERRAYINITTDVEAAVGKSGISDGMALVSAMQITAGVYVNDAEEGPIADIDQVAGATSAFSSRLPAPLDR